MFRQFSRMVSTAKEESLPRESELVKEKSVSSVASTPIAPPVPMQKQKSKTYGEINPFDPKVNVIVLNGDVMPTVSAVRVPGLRPRRKIASLPGRFVTLPIPDKLAGDGLTDTEFSNGIVMEEVVEDDPLPAVSSPRSKVISSPRASEAVSPRASVAVSPRVSQATPRASEGSPRAQINSRMVSMSRAQSKTAGLDNGGNSKETSPRAVDISTARGSTSTLPRLWSFVKANSATSQLSAEEKSQQSLGSNSASSPRAPSAATDPSMSQDVTAAVMAPQDSPRVASSDADSAAGSVSGTPAGRTRNRWSFYKSASPTSPGSAANAKDDNNKSMLLSAEEKPTLEITTAASGDDKDEKKANRTSFYLPKFPTAFSPRLSLASAAKAATAAKAAKNPKNLTLTLDNPDDMLPDSTPLDENEEIIVERPLTDFEISVQTLTDYLERPFVSMFHLYAWANLDDKERKTTKDRPTVTYEETVTLLRAMINWKEFGDKNKFFTLNSEEQMVAKELYMKLLTLLMVHGAIATGCDMSEVQRWHGNHLGYRIGGNIWSMSDLQKLVDYQEEVQDGSEIDQQQ